MTFQSTSFNQKNNFKKYEQAFSSVCQFHTHMKFDTALFKFISPHDQYQTNKIIKSFDTD